MPHPTDPPRPHANALQGRSRSALGQLCSEVFTTLEPPEIDHLIARAERLAVELPATTPDELLSELAYQLITGTVKLPVDRSAQLRYLVGVLRHHGHRRIRTLTQDRRRDQYLTRPTALLPDEEAARRERSAAIRAAIAHLPPRRRAVIELYCMEQRSAKEVGVTLGIRAPTVYREFQRAKPLLQNLLSEFSEGA